MRADVARVRPDRPSLFCDLRSGSGEEVYAELRHAVLFDRAGAP
jgi:hypothetical protein